MPTHRGAATKVPHPPAGSLSGCVSLPTCPTSCCVPLAGHGGQEAWLLCAWQRCSASLGWGGRGARAREGGLCERKERSFCKA